MALCPDLEDNAAKSLRSRRNRLVHQEANVRHRNELGLIVFGLSSRLFFCFVGFLFLACCMFVASQRVLYSDDMRAAETNLSVCHPAWLEELAKNAALFAQDFDLEKSKKSSVRWLSLNMNGTLGNNNVFNVSHIKKLHPLFKAGLLSGVKSLAKLTSAEVESPLFPKYFVLERRLS